MIKAKRIIVDSIKDHLIPQVSSKKTQKEMFDALSNLFEGMNIKKNDHKKSTQECKDTEGGNHADIVHKSVSN